MAVLTHHTDTHNPCSEKQLSEDTLLLLPCLLPPKGTLPKWQLQKMPSHWSSCFGAKCRENEWKGCFRQRTSCRCGRGQFRGGAGGSLCLPCVHRKVCKSKRNSAHEHLLRAHHLGRARWEGCTDPHPGVREGRPRKLFCPTARYHIVHSSACTS